MPDDVDFLFLIHDLARQLRVDADRRARGHGMTRAQWVILWWLDRQPGLSQKELAVLMDVEPITVARLVDRLARRGMLERRDDPSDRRIWRLHLLPPAQPVLAHMRDERREVRRILSAGLEPADVAAVEAGLRTMKANLVAELRTRSADAVAQQAPMPRMAPPDLPEPRAAAAAPPSRYLQDFV